MKTKFYPISKWNGTGTVVKLAFCFETEEKAITHAEENQNRYCDQKFQGYCFEAPSNMSINEIYEKVGVI